MPSKLERHAYWQAMIKEHQQSGLSISAFCRKKDLKESQFSYYFYNVLGKKASKRDQPNQAFTPITIKDKHLTAEQHYQVHLPTGIKITVPLNFEEEQLKRLIRSLM